MGICTVQPWEALTTSNKCWHRTARNLPAPHHLLGIHSHFKARIYHNPDKSQGTAVEDMFFNAVPLCNGLRALPTHLYATPSKLGSLPAEKTKTTWQCQFISVLPFPAMTHKDRDQTVSENSQPENFDECHLCLHVQHPALHMYDGRCHLRSSSIHDLFLYRCP